MIELYLLEQLKAFYECGTLSAAAKQLHLSQPSLSKSMNKIEQILDVKLFERTKNRLRLNELGLFTAKYAIQILDKEMEMEQHVKALARSSNTITIGSIAPGPLMKIMPEISACFLGMTITSNIFSHESDLIEELNNDTHNLIITTSPLSSEEYVFKKYCNEQLYLSIQHFHPASSMKSISFCEMDGQSFIMHSEVGFWDRIVRSKMPHAKYFLQTDLDAVGELQRSSDLPSFATDITLKMLTSRNNGRITIPFSDKEASASYYLICLRKNYTKYQKLFQKF